MSERTEQIVWQYGPDWQVATGVWNPGVAVPAQAASVPPQRTQLDDVDEPADDVQLLSATDQMWADVLGAHPKRYPLGERGRLASTGPAAAPLALYVKHPDGEQIAVVLADSLAAAVQPLEWTAGELRAAAFFTPGTRTELINQSPILNQAASAVSAGKALILTTRSQVYSIPDKTAGIYRIYGHLPDGNPAIYVGQSLNIRQRLQAHASGTGRIVQLGGWTPEGITQVSVHRVKTPGRSAAWTYTDLDADERRHIAKARWRQTHEDGPIVVNDSDDARGKKGIPAAHSFIWPS